ncbi:uncharacterized protein LOC110456732 isoform X2 [Mizuhopecten yessoensis]|nr:uncharacterized protein LOC110456732 isoform X2 [Mizuhopecten yessoensis]XP_021363326.1 uncharacterized protein LOC110456732 isoform X2 [Mizuhopecten yessoensis]XP_021363327.1 uncharacterized protein LOC110456732 isoform X2 [Mizuhopecten yessoensis]XP_021363328.1 uncharacterized protein LOC110456732 isoform X2 [Mizuhopecten yessoensis]
MNFKDPVENEDTSVPSLNLEILPSDMMRLVDGPDADQLFHHIFGGGANDSNDSSHSSLMSQGSQGSLGRSQPSPFAPILSSIPQPVEAASNPTMEVSLINSIIRFRYDSELNNRRTGKEELLKIKFSGIEGNVTVFLHTVDTNNKKAHPYWLIGDKCSDGMFVATVPINKANNYECTCKATLKIPKRNEYQTSLQNRRRKALEMDFYNNDMKNDDYWTANKNMKECRDFRLYVEAHYQVSGQLYHMHCITPPLSNAKEGKCFMIHRIMPYVSPASGIQNSKDYIMIVLTTDSYVPKAVEVEFVDEEIGWSAKASKVNIIKNCIECEVPPYKDQNLIGAKEVLIKINDKQKAMTAAYSFMYKENEETHTAKKRKMAVNYCAPADLLQESGINLSSSTDQHRAVLKATRTQKPGNGGFMPSPRVSLMTTQTSTATTEQSISHFGVNAPVVELPQLIVKKEPTDTYEGTCVYQRSSNAMFTAGEEVTNLLTRGQDPNLQSINAADPTSLTSVSLLLPSGSDGSDREVSMETGFNRPAPSAAATTGSVGGSSYSQVDQMNIQKILQDLKAGSPGQRTDQQEVSEPQNTDENLIAELLHNYQQNAIRGSDGQDNSQLNFPDNVTQVLNQPMYPISSSLGGRNSTQAPTHTGFPVRQTFNPALQRTTQDIQNMLSARPQYLGYEGFDATEAGDLETDGCLQAPDAVRLVWEHTKGSHAELGDFSETEVDSEPEFHNKLSSDTEGEDPAEPEVTRAEAVLVKQTHTTPYVEISGKHNKTESTAEKQDTCNTCINNMSDSSANVDKASEEGGQTAAVQADTSDLETDSCSGELDNETVGSNQIDPGVCARVGEVDGEACCESRSPRLIGDVEQKVPTIPHNDNTNKPTPQEDVSDSLKRLAL